MSLVPSLLQAIVNIDGEALVMHAGDKPYVVSPSGQVELASRGLTLDAVSGVVAQLLPIEFQNALDEFGAVQYALPAQDEFPGEQFTVVVARGGDDVWAEIRRRRIPDEDRIPEEFFDMPPSRPVSAERAAASSAAGMSIDDDVVEFDEAPAAVRSTPSEDGLAMPDAAHLWPGTAQQGETVVNLEEEQAVELASLEPEAPEVAAPPVAAAPPPPVYVAPPVAAAPPVAVAPPPLPPPVVVAPVAGGPPVAAAAPPPPVYVAPPVAVAPPPPPPPVVVAPVAAAPPVAAAAPPPEPVYVAPPVAVAPPPPPPPVVVAPVAAAPPVAAAAPPPEPVYVAPPVAAAPPPPPPPVVVAPVATASPIAAAAPPEPAHVAPPVAAAKVAPPSWSSPPPPRIVPPPAVVLPMTRSPIRLESPPPPADDTLSGLERLLRTAAARGASTLYLSSEEQPSVRVDGELQSLDGEPVHTASDVISLLLTLMPDRSHEALRTGATTEWISDIEDIGRVRCMSFRDHRGPGGVFRLMPVRTVSVEQLGLPREIQSLAIEPEGLVLIAGSRSSGKRTLMSSLVDLINRTRRDHVITIEREVNIVHARGSSFISQREVRGDDDEVLGAARAALREDPDVLVLEQIRTGLLMNVALEAAASGHLVIGGFSAHNATESIDRIIDLYAPEYGRQVQLALADNLRGVVAQVLLPKIGGGRVPAREVLLNTPAVAGVIAEGKTSQLPMAIEGGRRHGMTPLNDALVGYVQSGTVDVREAYRHVSDRPAFLALLKRQGIDTSAIERFG